SLALVVQSILLGLRLLGGAARWSNEVAKGRFWHQAEVNACPLLRPLMRGQSGNVANGPDPPLLNPKRAWRHRGGAKRILRRSRSGFAKFCARTSYVWQTQGTFAKQPVNPAAFHRLGW